MILHIISDFSRADGAQSMLARLLRLARDERSMLVSLNSVSDHLKSVISNPQVDSVALGLRSSVAAPAAVIRLAGLIRAERPDAILCWLYHTMPLGLAAARLAGTKAPVYFTVRQALDDPEALTASTRRAIRLSSWLSSRSDGIIYNSQRAREQHATFGFANANTAVVPNGFILPQIRPPSARKPTVFGIAGRFHPQKDHDTFFGAAGIVARERPEARFIVAGGGLSPGSPEVEAALARAGLPMDRVDLRGQVEHMASFYDDIDVLVLSSRTEGFPNVVGEAMSFGKPVVSTNVGDVAKVVGGAGRVVAPRDPRALAQAMIAMLDLDPEAYRAMACAAREQIERHYALDVIAARYRELLLSGGNFGGEA